MYGCGRQPSCLRRSKIGGSSAVPGLYCSDLKSGTYTVNILERDGQGRILYEYTTKSLITGEQETAVVICQKCDNDFVYFYEDKCYLTGEPSEEEIRQLKVQNRWGEETPLRARQNENTPSRPIFSF